MMKYIIMITCLFIGKAVVAQKAKMISAAYKNTPLHTVLKDIMKQTGMGYIIDSKCLDQSNTVTLDASNIPLKDVLKKICADNAIKFYMADKIIYLASDTRPVRGRVVNQMGDPVAGVTVRSGDITTLTNNNGSFYLRTPTCDKIIKLFHSGDSVTYHLGKTQDVTLQMKTAIVSSIN